MLDPEYYVSQYRLPNGSSWETTSYRDTLDETLPPTDFHHHQDDGSSTRLAERRPVLIIPVPNENTWASPSSTLPPPFFTNNNNNAAADDDDDGAARSKRVREEDGDVDMAVTAPAEDENPSNNNNNNMVSFKASKIVQEGKRTTTTATTKNDTSITSPPPGACMVYLYDTESSSSIRLNDIVEVVGVLSKVPELATPHMMNGTDNGTTGTGGVESMLEEEVLASHLPTSLVPRIHAITTRSSSSSSSVNAIISRSNEVSVARHRIMGILTTILSGDELAAEYVLLQLLARVHMRTGGGGASGGGGAAAAAVGVPSLNLIEAPAATNEASSSSLSNLGNALNAVLQALTPRSMALPLKVDTLNAKPWWPRRHGGTLRLMTGPLQLAPGTQILLDETVMQSGTLNEVGLRNLSAVQSIIKTQCVGYDFEYFSLDQPTDAPVTVLSTGRSLLKSSVDTVVPLRPCPSQQGGHDDVASLLLEREGTTGDLNGVRRYLSAVRGLDLKIGGDVSRLIEGDLAGARQKDARVGEETFHKWLTVARLMAVSWGEGELTGERWKGAMEMEKRRMVRTGELIC